MTDKVETVVRESLRQVAPGINIIDIERDENLREQFDMDSMDFLRLVARLSDELHVTIPESDYTQMETYTTLLSYLISKEQMESTQV